MLIYGYRSHFNKKNELILGDTVPINILNVIARKNVTLAHKYSLWNF